MHTQRTLCITLLTALLVGSAAAQGNFDTHEHHGHDELHNKGGIPDGFRLIDGDILVPIITTRGTFNALQWTGGVVPYQFDTTGSDAVSSVNQQLVLDAMEGGNGFTGWEQLADVNFRPATPSDTDFILIRDSSNDLDPNGNPNPRNNSALGMVGGSQIINLFFSGNGSTRGVIAHELGHALGYYHEQSRQDRDTFVNINNGCIIASRASNFDKRTGAGGEYGPYDYESIMHYGPTAFANGACNTITATPTADDTLFSGDPNNMGQRTGMTVWDGRIMSFLYPESDWVFVDGSTPGVGTFDNPAVSFTVGQGLVPDGGTIWILEEGNYATGGRIDQPMTIRAGHQTITLTD